jgi:uncharacterized protein YecE (DUF72 family)
VDGAKRSPNTSRISPPSNSRPPFTSHPTEQVHLAWERTQEIADILDARVVVFQFPASFVPTRESARNLTAFFKQIDRHQRLFAWEPRGHAW